ncbi:MAG: Ppx/GppA family phosphatase [Phycisphaerae bacterium]|nr:Ppx/GppA family phosphatase [Phycisphaerae bacterium]
MSGPGQNGHSSVGPRRLGAIDVGTNSLRLIVAEASPDSTYRVLDDEKAITRLGRGLARTNRLHPDTMEESVLAIARMKGIAEGYGVTSLRVIGTAAVREAENGPQFCELVKQRTGLSLVPITAEEEARLAFLSASHAFDLRESTCAVVDIGGGSTEIVLASGGIVEQVYTSPLGAVRLTEMFPGVESPGHEPAYNALRKHVRKALRDLVGPPPISPQFIIGTGGTFTTVASVSMQRGSTERDSGMLPFAMRGHELQRSEIRHTLDWLRQIPIKARLRVPGLSADRAEIIIAGLAVVEGVMKHLGVNSIRVHDRGIRDGLLLTMLGEIYPSAERQRMEPVDRLRSARHFAQNCRYEEAHSNHVATLALQVFDQLAAQRPEVLRDAGTPWAREILYIAALLHDVGYFINYSKHHKHSYHLIVHSDLPGFTHRELEIIANIARYHRRAEPKLKHATFAKLAEADRALVSRLAGILRTADGLDRTHTQSVRSIRLRIAGDDACFLLDAQEEPSVDMWGSDRKGSLFEKIFRLRPRFEWAGALSPTLSSTERTSRTHHAMN